MSETNIFFIATLAAMALVIILVTVLFYVQNKNLRRDREKLMGAFRRENEIQKNSVEQLSQSVGQSMRQMAEFSGALDARMDALTRQNNLRLEEMRRMVGEKLDSRLSESFKMVNAQLADVHRGIGEMRGLAANVTDIKKVLGNVKTRGVWGEMVLESVLSQMLSPEQYIKNAAIPEGSQTRVEFALRLPDRSGETTLLPVDSKFPQEDYIRLMEADAEGNGELRAKCAHMLERALLEQAKTISDKYIRPPQTTDFAVMFLPVEGLYAEAAGMSGFIEKIQTKYRVLIAGPSTLCALLTSLQMGWRTSELEKRSGELLELFDELRVEFSRFQEGIVRTRQKLNQAEAELDTLENRARKISKKLM